MNMALFALIMLTSLTVDKTRSESVKLKSENVTAVFLERMIEDFGTNGSISLVELDDSLPSEHRNFNSCVRNVTSTHSLKTCLEKKVR